MSSSGTHTTPTAATIGSIAGLVAAHLVLVGPTSGAAATPTFRALEIADLTFAGAANGVATLDSGGKLTAAQLPSISITDTFVVASQAAMLALSAQTGDIAIRSDQSKTYILSANDPTILGNWTEVLFSAPVTSVNGQTGVVSLASTNLSDTANIARLNAANVFTVAQIVNQNTAAAPAGVTGYGMQVVAADGVVARYEADSFAAISAFTARRANGTNASKSALASGDQIGGFNFYGYGTSAYSGVQGSVQGFATQTWTNANQGTKIVIATTPNNSTTLTSAVTFDQDQSLTVVGNVTAPSYTLSGNISAAAWTTNGVRFKAVASTLTDTSSSGTVTAAYTNVFGGNTIAASNLNTIFTDYFTAYFKSPIAGSNVTLTNKWSLGTDNINVVGNAAASSPSVTLTGTWFSGGSATTTKPKMLIELAGTTSTGWSTAGTGLGINAASGFAGNLMDMQIQGVSVVKTTVGGVMTLAGGGVIVTNTTASGVAYSVTGTVTGGFDGFNASMSVSGTLAMVVRNQGAGGAQNFIWGGSGGDAWQRFLTAGDWSLGSKRSTSAFVIANGDTLGATAAITIANSTVATMFGGLVQFLGTTSSFPALKRSATILQVRLADDSAFAPLQGKLRTDSNATTGLTAGVLSALTNASIEITDNAGQLYRVPVII